MLIAFIYELDATLLRGLLMLLTRQRHAGAAIAWRARLLRFFTQRYLRHTSYYAIFRQRDDAMRAQRLRSRGALRAAQQKACACLLPCCLRYELFAISDADATARYMPCARRECSARR